MSEEQVAEVAEAEAPSEAISDFRASLPEDLREHSALAPIQDVENLAKAYVCLLYTSPSPRDRG